LGSLYNPLDKTNLGISVRDALLKQPVVAMAPPPDRFNGAGIYAIYYTGDFQPYRQIATLNRDGKFSQPIYVGKAVPAGARKGGTKNDLNKPSTKLQERLRQHANSIRSAVNLLVEDFVFRYLTVDDIWIPLGETYMIDAFEPVWNKVVEGFGIHTPGKRRKGQYTSAWDTLHPGRTFVQDLELPPNPKTATQIIGEVENYLALPRSEQARLPVKDNGDPEDDEPSVE
jgi:Eco29kI restriction endonuclease